MKEHLIDYLCCPSCKCDLQVSSVIETVDDRIKEGGLVCSSCKAVYLITSFIPRFTNDSGYAESFGTQWNNFAKVQIDSKNIRESQIRFDTEVGWSASDINGKVVLEVGSGAGRFLDVVSRREPALVIGIDLTTAVDACYSNVGDRDNVFIIQGDIFNPPVRDNSFDMAYSIGVLHHTPEPEKAFLNMCTLTRDNGSIALSLYEISLYERPNRNSLRVASLELMWSLNLWRCELFRVVTTRLPKNIMVTYCKFIVPVLHFINKIPVLRFFRYLLPSTCYKHLPYYWSTLDTMDTYATEIVHQYRSKDIFQWFLKLGLSNIILLNSRPGWVSIRANKGSAHTRLENKLTLRSAPAVGVKVG